MEDSKKIKFPSSPTFSSPGNNENESENKRNSGQRNKKSFMAPTISTSSKKKKILAERKPPKGDTISGNGVSKISSFSEDDTFVPDSSSTIPYVSKISSFSEDDTFVPDSSTIPYDPLTNYLSPRPKFLRYNPNRKRNFVLQREAESGSSNSSSRSSSPERVSVDSQSSCTVVETEGKEQEFEEGKEQEFEEEKEQEFEEEKEEEEEMIDERELGLKWVVFCWLVLFSVLVFSTMYISSMNSPPPTSTNYPEKIEFQDFGNITFGAVSFRKIDSEKGFSEMDQFGAESPAVSFRKIDSGNWVFDGRENSEKGLSEMDQFGAESPAIDIQEKDQDGVSVLNSEIDFAEETRVFDDFYQKIRDFDGVFPEIETENEAPIVVEPMSEGIVDEKQLIFEAPIAAPDLNMVTQEENLIHFEPKLKDVVAENHQIDGIRGLNIDEISVKEVRTTQANYILLVGVSVMVYVVCMVYMFFRECKQAFTKKGVSSIRKRNNTQVFVEEKDSLAGADPGVITTSTVVDIESREEILKTPPKRILTAKQLGEVDFGGGFSGKMQERDGSVCSVTDERRAKKSKVSYSSSASASASASEYAKQESGKEEGTAVRRSERLRNRGVTSP